MLLHFEDGSMCVRNQNKTKKALQSECFRFAGDPYGNRTHVSTLRGSRLSRLTNGPLSQCLTIIAYLFLFCNTFFEKYFIFLKKQERLPFLLFILFNGRVYYFIVLIWRLIIFVNFHNSCLVDSYIDKEDERKNTRNTNQRLNAQANKR